MKPCNLSQSGFERQILYISETSSWTSEIETYRTDFDICTKTSELSSNTCWLILPETVDLKKNTDLSYFCIEKFLLTPLAQ